MEDESSRINDSGTIKAPDFSDGVVEAESKQQAESTGKCILRIKVRRIPGTNLYKNLSYVEKNQDAEIQQSETEPLPGLGSSYALLLGLLLLVTCSTESLARIVKTQAALLLPLQ